MAEDSRPEYSSGTFSQKDIVWDERPKSLRDLVSSCRLPFPVKLHKGDLSKYFPPCQTDSDDVLHVLEIRRRKIVLGKRLQWEKRVNDYVVSGEQLEIPAFFKGWFEVVPDDGRPVEYFDTINGITSVKPRRFLVRTSTVGYQLSVEDGVNCWMPCEIKSGEVLTTGMIYMDNKKNKSSSQMRKFFRKILKSSKGSRKDQDMKYLQCYDGEGKEIMIPLIMSGVFSPVGDAAVANYDAVYELQDLIMAFGFPVNAQIIYSGTSERSSCPNGVIRLEATREEEYALVSRVPSDSSVGSELTQGEIPIDDALSFLKESSKRRKNVKNEQTDVAIKEVPKQEEFVYGTSNIELPKRAEKDVKKSKTSAILDKLSVRRTKKERAKLKALKGDDVFSKRLHRSEVSYEDFFNGLDHEDKENENDPKSSTAKSSDNDSETYKSVSNSEVLSKVDQYSSSHKIQIQNRDLPPIPTAGKHTSHESDLNLSKDSIYEHLPPAPKPPNQSFTDLNDLPEDDDDGYMVPMSLRHNFESPYSAGADVILRRKPPSAPRDSIRYSRSRKAKSEIPSPYGTEGNYNEGSSIDIDDLFSFAYSQNPKERPYGTITARHNSTSQLYGSSTPKGRAPPWRAHITPNYDGKFLDDFDLESRQKGTPSKYKSRSQRNLNMDLNATIRSHNLRKMKNVMEVFHFSDSFRDLRDGESLPEGYLRHRYDQNPYIVSGDYSEDHEQLSPGYYSSSGEHGPYPESEPGYRRYQRSVSINGLSDTYIKQGDDSAISLCSRGDYGYPNGSDYSYSEYGEIQDDGFIPPNNIEHLTVKEVSKSLRYIGMKDRVVLRFSNEQIDGNMLSTLDKKLLKEGFPELNALEIKKILDFVGGWRPKKI